MECQYSFKNKNVKITFVHNDYYRYVYNICSILKNIKKRKPSLTYDSSFNMIFHPYDTIIKFSDVDFLISTLKILQDDKNKDLLKLVMETNEFNLDDIICDNNDKNKIIEIIDSFDDISIVPETTIMGLFDSNYME